VGDRASIGAAVGRQGLVSVVRDLGLRDLVTGQTAIRDGEIDSDVEGYLIESEQLDSALTCETLLDARGQVRAAAGILVQALPGGGGAEVVAAARARHHAGALAALLDGAAPASSPTIEALARAALGDEAARSVAVLDRRPVRFVCPCSHERAAVTLALLGEAELAAMIREDGKADVACNFCRAQYVFTARELEEIRDAAMTQTPPS
jgi:molecular chaperone Hsp33